MASDIETTVRARLRAIRQRQGWSLDELAARSTVGASTISRIETGKRALGLDVLVPLATALGVGVDELVAPATDSDVVVRPTPSNGGGRTIWALSRPGSATSAYKIRLEPTAEPPEPAIHPGHDWLFVIDGSVILTLGEREIRIGEGEAAEFPTMTPHAVAAVDEPAELIMIFDRDGERAHLHGPS